MQTRTRTSTPAPANTRKRRQAKTRASRSRFALVLGIVFGCCVPVAAPGADDAPVTPDAAALAQTIPNASTDSPHLPPGQGTSMYASVIVNDMPVGSYQVERYPGGDFAIRKTDLVAMGIEKPVGQTFSLDGEDYLLLSTLETSKFRFDERHVEIAIEIDPSVLRRQVIDARHRVAATNVLYPRNTSAFFNYSLSHDTIDYTSDTVSGELGIRQGDFLFLTDGFYEHREDEDRSIRLRTSLTHSNRETLQETVFGDFIATSGALGSNLNLGGISFSKNYRMDPYLVRFPFASYAGLAQTPARYEVLVNGTRVSTGTLDPGPFDITNIQGPLGVSNVEVVVRDAFGREQIYSTPFYYTQAALRAGLAEYNFGLGRQREEFGIASNNYGPVAGTGFYRYGITDALTLGARAEASEEVFNLGPNVTVLAGQWGLFNTTLSYSNDSENDGYAGVFDYAIQTRKFNASASVLAQSRHYARVGIDQQYNTRFEARTAFSLGPYTLTYNTLHPYQGVDRTSYGVSVTPRLPTPRVSLFASVRRIEAEQSGTEFYIGVNYYFRNDYSISGAVRTFDDDHQASGTIQKAIPVGEGWAFRHRQPSSTIHAAAATRFGRLFSTTPVTPPWWPTTSKSPRTAKNTTANTWHCKAAFLRSAAMSC